MATPEESFVNKFVIQQVGTMRWKTYRVIATRSDLQALSEGLAASLATNGIDDFEDENGAKYRPVWSSFATEAYVRTDRTQIEFAIADDVAPYHRRTRKWRFKDRADVLLLAALAAIFVVGLLSVGYFGVRGIDWLLFSQHRG